MARGTGGKIVNRQELAAIFGVSLPTVDQWVRNGCPFLQKGAKGREWQFDTAEVAQWRADEAAKAAGGADELDEEATRREIRKLDLAQRRLDYAKAADLVVPVDQVERTLAKLFATLRANMRNIPDRTVSALIGETSEKRFKRVLLEEIDRALEVMADVDLVDVNEDDDTEPEPAE